MRLRYGQTLYVRMANTACLFVRKYNGDTTFPLAVFDRMAIASLRDTHTGMGADNLYGSAHPLARLAC